MRKLLKEGSWDRHHLGQEVESPLTACQEQLALYLGLRHCVATSTFTWSLHLCLRAAGVSRGSEVLSNAYLGMPAEVAIRQLEARLVPVANTRDLVIDLEALERTAHESKAKFLLLSHVCGFTPDLDAVGRICAKMEITVIEDCGDCIGGLWDNRHVGCHSQVACFSAEPHTVVSASRAGGGFAASNSRWVGDFLTWTAGYHNVLPEDLGTDAAPSLPSNVRDSPVFEVQMPNCTAAVLRPQIANVEEQVAAAEKKYRDFHSYFHKYLRPDVACNIGLHVPKALPKAKLCRNSFQFLAQGLSCPASASAVVDSARQRGVPLQVFTEPASSIAGAAAARVYRLSLPPRCSRKEFLHAAKALNMVLSEAAASMQASAPCTADLSLVAAANGVVGRRHDDDNGTGGRLEAP